MGRAERVRSLPRADETRDRGARLPGRDDLLLTGKLDRFVQHSENRFEAGYLENLPGGRARAGELKLSAEFARLPVCGKQHVDSCRVAEVDT